MKKILVTGAFGQIGSELVPALQKKYGQANVFAAGHKGSPISLEIRDKSAIEKLIKKYKISNVYHLVSLLSAKGEINPDLTWDINVNGLKNVLDLALKYKLQVFWPSSIAAFGPTTPKIKTPQFTIMEPSTMYGVTKLVGENLCHYYFLRYGLDVRSLRYPGLISWKTPPEGGTTDFAVAVFYDGIKYGSYKCFVGPDTMLPMMYMDDGVAATIQLMDADPKKISIRTSYNLAAMSFTARDLVTEINKHLKVNVIYKPDHRQEIADSWPKSINDSQAREDWGWKPKYDLNKMTTEMIKELYKKFKYEK